MHLYRFSPIQTETQLKEAVSYLIQQEERLAAKVVGNPLAITYLTIFSHYLEEYEVLVGFIQTWGEVTDANNGVKTRLNEPFAELDQNINELRIRKPDPYRMQVGCCDFGVDDYYGFKKSHLANNPNLRLIEREEYEMIEFFDPDFDALAYIVSP